MDPDMNIPDILIYLTALGMQKPCHEFYQVVLQSMAQNEDTDCTPQNITCPVLNM